MNQTRPTRKVLRILLILAFVTAAILLAWIYLSPQGMGDSVSMQPPLPMRPRAPESAQEVEENVEPLFNFFADVDRKLIASNLEQLDAPFQKHPRPQGMDDDVYSLCNLLLDTDVSIQDLFRLTKEQAGAVVDMGFIKDGEYLVTLGDKLTVWRAATGEKVREHAVPLSGAKQLLVSSDPASAVLVSDKALVKCSLVDGKVVRQSDIPPGIAYASMAYETGSVALSTSDMHIVYMSPDLKSGTKLDNATLATARIAAAPDKPEVLFFNDKKPARWVVDKNLIEQLQCDELDVSTAIPIAGKWISTIWTAWGMYAYNGAELIYPVPLSSIPLNFKLHSEMVQVLPTISNRNDTFVLLARERLGGPAAVRVMDTQLHFGSKPLVLTDGADVKLTSTRTGHRLAIQTGDELRVVQRRPWVSNEGHMWTLQMLPLFKEGRFAQLDLVGDYIRQHKRLPCNETGEAIYKRLVDHIGETWSKFEQDEKSQEVYEKAEQWKAGKSALALCASAARHMRVGALARGGGLADTVTDEGWQTFGERNQLAIADLSAVPAETDLPATSYEMTLELLKNAGGTPDLGDRILKEYTARYPFETMGHRIGCHWSLERWGGRRGQSRAYLNELAKLYPEEIADLIYARVACRFQTDLLELEPNEFGVDQQRTLRGLQALAQREWLGRNDMERALGYYYKAGMKYEANNMAKRHLQEHDLVGEEGYMQGAYILLNEVRHSP